MRGGATRGFVHDGRNRALDADPVFLKTSSASALSSVWRSILYLPRCVRTPAAYLATELQTLRDQGFYRKLRVLDEEQKARTSIHCRSVINLSSNNYLGLTTHPKLRERAIEATRTLAGSGSVRTIAGTMDVHMQLERKLAEFKRTEAAVVFQSGFAANAGTVAAILGRDDAIISDELNHASIIDGARLSRATIRFSRIGTPPPPDAF